jgi:inorganic pyrophosphatase
MPDGKPANRYAYDAKALDKAHAERVVMETHAFYLRLKAGTQPNTDGHVGLAAA